MNKLFFLLVAFSLFATCSKEKGPLGPNAERGAMVYEQGGAAAAGVAIKFFLIGDTSKSPSAMCTTDISGRYSAAGFATGEYNLLAEKDSLVFFQSHAIISPSGTTLRNDTLYPSSSLSGIVGVKYPHDPRTVRISVMGIDKQVAVMDTCGNFIINGLPEGTWSLFLRSSLPDYLPLSKTISLGKSSHLALSDTIRLPALDIPFISGIKISQDTFAGTIKLSWEKINYKNCVDYVIFKASCSDLAFPDAPSFVTEDFVLVDSIPVIGCFTPSFSGSLDNTDDSLSHPDTSQTEDSIIDLSQCFRYRIAARTWEGKIGPTKGYAQIRFAPKAAITTSFVNRVSYPVPEIDNASIRDTLTISLIAKNPTRPLKSISWYEPNRNDTIAKTIVRGLNARRVTDSIRIAFDSIGTNAVIAIVLDSAGSFWFDTIPVNIVDDVPSASAGPDTGVFSGTKVNLHGSGVDLFGKIVAWKWKIGDGAWSATGTSDTSFIAPLSEETVLCSLEITNTAGNKAFDEIRVFPSNKVIGIAASIDHDFFLKSDGTLYGQGYNYYGQLGQGIGEFEQDPIKIMSAVKTVSAGTFHSLIVKTDGTLWVCGSNDSGQLGDGVSPPHPFPIQLMTNVQSVSAGRHFSLILKNDGTLFACGANNDGQLGDGTCQPQYFPVQVLTNVKCMAAGEAHSIVVKNDGTVWTVGRNRSGQLGIGNGSTLVKYTSVWHKILSDVQDVSAGYNYSLFLKKDKTLLACGTNRYGQLGDGTMEDRYAPVQVNTDVQSMVAGTGFSMVVKTDKTLWACGWNYYGDWGAGTFETKYQPSKVASDVEAASGCYYYALILKTDGTVWTGGPNQTNLFRIFPYMAPPGDDD